MAFPTLGITSPLTKTKHVKTAQHALKANVFHTNFLGSAKVDGQYGPLTGAAAHRAKWNLGYAPRDCNKAYGDTLHAYLTGAKKLSKVMLARRKMRLKAAATQNKNATMRAKLVKAASSYDGVKESPAGTNRVLFSEWYGMIGAWCAMFISFLLAVKLGVKFWRYAYVPYVVADARAHKSMMFEVHPDDALPGDLYCADWNRNGEYDHIGILRTKVANGRWGAWDGNTGPTDFSNGGMVMPVERNMAQGRFVFIRINFV